MITQLITQRKLNLLNLELNSLLIPRKVTNKLNKRIKHDLNKAWQENDEADKELKALYDIDSVEYAVKHQIPF